MTISPRLEETVPIWQSVETQVRLEEVPFRPNQITLPRHALPFMLVLETGGTFAISGTSSEIPLPTARHVLPDLVTQIQTEVEHLEARLTALEEEIAILKDSLPKERVVVLRDIRKEQAKKEILGLFEQGQPLFYSDIVETLGIDLPLVVEICEELIAEGEVMPRADAVN